MSSKSDYLSIASVEMPEEIIEAATNDSLAIFAGAGVSMQPPEGLGSFEELTNTLFNSIDVTNQVELMETSHAKPGWKSLWMYTKTRSTTHARTS